ncbi:EAL domain-containing protein [Spiribacter vilamensis]|uniref:PAS domain S-box-containing protein/diguanylate cyclase (GGDEF)-like protein n=1 Tax=Spiribacter vilamensis TaxID=531306 RepID=A0A4Q8D063_9GAMM|nr:EAL domain-containing protein [Spiribacter vilamensis]RZU98689.1 PAS domain S-box-containing protein/diguanylate cyclase (GGDEF)-like protein [Spiribacter vilamensis]TVO62285.1 EAL domain-containing protein [Spiribacter vilamensis]
MDTATTNAFFEAIYESADIGICVTDENRCFVRVNDAYCTTYGYTREELIGRPFTTVLPEGLRETAGRMHDEFLAGGDESAGEWQVVRKDGAVRDIMVTAGRVVMADGRRYKVTTVTDISERKATDRALRQTEGELRSLIENMPDGVLFEDSNRRVRLANQALIDLLRIPERPDAIVGSDCRDAAQAIKPLFTDPEGFATTIEEDVAHCVPALAERLETMDGRILQRDYVPIPRGTGEPPGHLWRYQDITERIRGAERLERMAYFDTLTGLPNRFLLNDRLEQAMMRLNRSSHLIAVAYIDLDGFKTINDRHGYTRGDWALTGIARRLRQNLRESDILARVGGDEFVVVLDGLRNRADGDRVINNLHETVTRYTESRGYRLAMTASIGVTFYPQTERLESEQLVRQADQAMYVAKRSGKNRYVTFDPDHDHAIRGQHETIDAVRQALAAGQLLLHYQPKVDMRSGRVIGAEALLRWQHPVRGLLTPGDFLPALERTAAAVEVGDWVLETVASQIVAWRRQGYEVPVSINVDGHQIAQPDFVTKLEDCLHRHPEMEPNDLELEVLESSALDDIDRVRAVIVACGELGIGFELDDFGTGYSTLNYLKRLPAPVLKIDQSFVRNMLDDANDLAILNAVQGLASAFSRHMIAEGVETLEHGTMLLALGCQFAQGYGIARPMPPEALPSWIDSWAPPAQWQSSQPVDRDDLPALFAMVDHRQWIHELEQAVYHQGPPPTLEPDERRLGQWLAASIIPISEAALTVTNRQRRTALNRIRSIHQSLFAEAELLVTAGTVPDAETWQSLKTRSDEMIDLLFNTLGQQEQRNDAPHSGPTFPNS